MSSLVSTPKDITEGIPFYISTRTAPGASGATARARTHWDVSIGGIGFVLDATDDTPYIRQTVVSQKQQMDTSVEAGEQTLSGYWLRSQTSWHHGAGINFYEPGLNDAEALPTRYRFLKSVGIDPWNIGDLKLLKKMVSAQSTVNTVPRVAGHKNADGTDGYFSVDNGTLKRWTAAGSATSYTGATALNVAIAGTDVLVGTTTNIYKGALSGTTLTSLYNTGPAALTPYWLKNRIMATCGPKIYELALDGTTGGGNLSTVTPAMTHPDASWTWTCMDQSPAAILAAGYSGGIGAIYAFTLKDSATAGGSPVLSQGYQVAEFPPGEEVHSIKVYLGAYVGIGTSRGVRVGLVDATGQIQYGPLLVTTTNPVKALAARDSYLFAGVSGEIDGKSGAARINLAETIGGDSLIFPWNWDAQTHTVGSVTSMCFIGTTDRLVVAAGSDALWVQSATDYETNGYLISGAIRYGTTEPKAWRAFDVRADTSLGGSVAVSVIDSGGSETSLIVLGAGVNGSNISLAQLPEGLEYISYKLTLTAATTVTPSVESIAVKVLPSAQPQTRVQYPVLIVDQGIDSGGGKYGHRGYAAEQVTGIDDLLVSQTVVQVSDYTFGLNGETFPAVVESFEFTRTTPATKGPEGANFGGRAKILVRRVA